MASSDNARVDVPDVLGVRFWPRLCGNAFVSRERGRSVSRKGSLSGVSAGSEFCE